VLQLCSFLVLALALTITRVGSCPQFVCISRYWPASLAKLLQTVLFQPFFLLHNPILRNLSACLDIHTIRLTLYWEHTLVYVSTIMKFSALPTYLPTWALLWISKCPRLHSAWPFIERVHPLRPSLSFTSPYLVGNRKVGLLSPRVQKQVA
jgi:hypothetical protein